MLPLNRKRVAPPAEEGESAEGEPTFRQPCGRLDVLVVDDNHLVRIMVRRGLERDGQVFLLRQ